METFLRYAQALALPAALFLTRELITHSTEPWFYMALVEIALGKWQQHHDNAGRATLPLHLPAGLSTALSPVSALGGTFIIPNCMINDRKRGSGVAGAALCFSFL